MISLLIPRAYADFTVNLPIGIGGPTYSTFGDYFTALVTLAVYLAGIISVFIVVYAGFLYSHSQGKSEQISQAKELVSGALIGMAILLLIRIILPTLGITSIK